MSETVQVLPLPKVKGYWQHSCSKYPDVIKVPMSDGKVVTYHIHIEQPRPEVLAAIENIRKLEGYTHEHR